MAQELRILVTVPRKHHANLENENARCFLNEGSISRGRRTPLYRPCRTINVVVIERFSQHPRYRNLKRR